MKEAAKKKKEEEAAVKETSIVGPMGSVFHTLV